MIRTRSGLPKHCGWNTDRHGKRRVRFRKNGFSTYLTGTPWSEDFMRQYATALDGVAAQQAEIGADRTTPGTINALCVSYYRSPEFRGLKASTQVVRRRVIEHLRAEHGDKPLKGLARVHIKAIIGAKADTPEAANNLLKVVRTLLAYAVDIEMVAANPAIGIKGYKSRGEGFHTWTETEVAQFQKRHPIDSKAGLALALMLYTAQRRGDAVKLGWQCVRGGAIVLRQEKTGEPLIVPMHQELLRALQVTPRTNLTFLLTERGKPFTAAGFGNWFRERCDEAGLPQCAAHGLRKLAATRLADAGASTNQIMAITGHRTLAALAPYIRRANQAKLAREAVAMMRGGAEQSTDETLSNLAKNLVQPWTKTRS